MLRRMILVILVFGIWACQESASQQSESTASQELTFDRPQLRRIAIANRAEADSLINLGLDLIVVEETYVVARIEPADSVKIQAGKIVTQPVKEEDLVQRLVKISVAEKSDVQQLADFGMDIWEVNQDTVLAQVFDKQIRQAEAKGFSVIIVEKNVLNRVKKKEQ